MPLAELARALFALAFVLPLALLVDLAVGVGVALLCVLFGAPPPAVETEDAPPRFPR